MKLVLLGAGKQARGALSYFQLTNFPIDEIKVVDRDESLARNLVEEFQKPVVKLSSDKSPSISYGCLDASNLDDCISLLRGYDLAFNALPFFLALNITKAAIHAQCNLVDLGGNNEVVEKQRELNDQAVLAGVKIIPDCGLAPGLVSLLVSDALEASKIDKNIDVKIYVGGLPRHRAGAGVGPLEYGEFFSLEGLINEYTQPVKVLRGGAIAEIEPLSECEEINICGETLEAFTTSGGSSTMPETFKERIVNLQYKTLRFPGHLRCLKLLQAIGSLNVATMSNLCEKDLDDQVFVKVVVSGNCLLGSRIVRTYSLRDVGSYYGGTTAMMRCTAWPAATILMMTHLESGFGTSTVSVPGVHRQENAVDPGAVIDLLKRINLKISIKETVTR
jgi:lysine 6-dehydrogenase